MVRLSKPTKKRAALSVMPLRLRAGAAALAKFCVALVSFAALPQRLAQPVPLGEAFVGRRRQSAALRDCVPVGRGVWAACVGVGLGPQGGKLACGSSCRCSGSCLIP